MVSMTVGWSVDPVDFGVAALAVVAVVGGAAVRAVVTGAAGVLGALVVVERAVFWELVLPVVFREGA